METTGQSATNEYVVKDSGARASFATGAVRDTDEGKSRPDLISAPFLLRLGIHLAKGAKKYKERNWELGIPASRCFGSALRHLLQWSLGMRDEDHLAAAAFNIMAIMHFEELKREDLLDHPSYQKSTQGH